MASKSIEGVPVAVAVREVMASRLTADASRKEKSRLAASVLFFDHGVYPSAKVVLECTQQGSLTDINRDLQAFWKDLRDKSRLQLVAPGLPEDLLAQFGEALRRLWTLASDKAQEEVQALRQEAADQVRQAQQDADVARRAEQAAQERTEAVEQEIREERARREEAEKRMEVQHAEIEALTASVEGWRRRLVEEASARKEAEERFSRDLASERQDRVHEAERFKGEIVFAKQQIEAARSSERVLREQLAGARAGLEVDLASYRQRLGRAEEAHNAAKQEVAELKGRNSALESRVGELQEWLKELAKAGSVRAMTAKPTLKRRSLR